MPPLEGFDCKAGSSTAAKAPEINNNEPIFEKKAVIENADAEVDDPGQRLHGRPVQEGDVIEKEAQNRTTRGRQFVWHNIVLIFLTHFLALWSTCTYIGDIDRKTVLFCVLLGGIGGIGVTAGCHRMWSHRAYKAKLPLRVLLALSFSVAGQNSILEWVRDHRVHHKFTETDADPHNVKRGFFFAHVGWLMQRKHPDVLRQGRKVDMSDVEADPVVQWHEKYFLPLKILLCFIVPTLIPVYCWNEKWHISFFSTAVVRYVCLLNFTWLVNSAAHMFGDKPFDKRINPAENKFVSFLALGEGWHNYHHVFPWDYKTSEYSYYFNVTTFWIDLFARLGLAYDLKTATPDMVRKVALKHGDGTHPVHRREEDHFHPDEVTYDEYLKVMEEDDEYTGVTKLENEHDVTRKRHA
ncbi:Acyl-CoA desaturase 1 [Frankliniella fusca]|uniref:Acyl-CoA desaturase 1 n=2 Tax=Arthropoda TaxID=6656 RepID=A0AAE1LB73_9NEOP|nr:Acyl-CoA desaturase 1 [Frankliniella fusca]